jgi:hypothetical protein
MASPDTYSASATELQNLYSNLQSQTNTLNANNFNSRRQYEINEWTSNNKLDTLFFYQLLLISLSAFAPLLYLNKNGLIPSAVFYGVTGIIGIAVVLTLIIRIQYTVGSRDLRYWNRRRFGQKVSSPAPITCDSILAQASEVGALYNKDSDVIKKQLKDLSSK